MKKPLKIYGLIKELLFAGVKIKYNDTNGHKEMYLACGERFVVNCDDCPIYKRRGCPIINIRNRTNPSGELHTYLLKFLSNNPLFYFVMPIE